MKSRFITKSLILAAILSSSSVFASEVFPPSSIKSMTCIGTAEAEGSDPADVRIYQFGATTSAKILKIYPSVKTSKALPDLKAADSLALLNEFRSADYGLQSEPNQIFYLNKDAAHPGRIGFQFIANWKASGSVDVKTDANGTITAEGSIEEKSLVHQLRCSIQK